MFGAPVGGGAGLSERERAHYGSLWTQVDAQGQGRVGGLQAAGFLAKSGLDRKVLREIWDIADHAKQGSLGFEEFTTAFRLVAHAQAGRPITPEAAYVEPAVLARFDDAPSAAGGHVGSSAGAATRGRSPARSTDRLVPTPRDLRKYGRLFMTATNQRGGLLTADGAKELFNKSGLDQAVLTQIWDLADADRDRHLSWSEFVVAMHLIRRARAGQPLPPTVPGDIRNIVATLDTAESYASQPSRSPRTRAFSTASAASLFDTAGSRPSTPPRGTAAVAEPFPTSSGWDLAASDKDETQGKKQDGTGGGWDGAGGFDEKPAKSKSKSKKKKKEEETAVELPPPAATDDFGEGARFGSPFATTQGPRAHSPEFGGRGRAPSDSFFGPALGEDAQPVEHLEALIEAEKKMVYALRADLEELNDERSRLEEACRFEERDAARESTECERIGQERKHLEQQLEASKRQLAELKAEHHGLHLESILLRRDRGHYGAEVQFLQKLFDEGTRDTEALQQSIEYLEQSNASLAAHTRSLEEARQDILDQARLEKDLLKKEEQEARSAKLALETLRGGAADVDALAKLGSPRHASPPGTTAFGFGASAFDDLARSDGALGGSGGLSALATMLSPPAPEPPSGQGGGGAAYQYRPAVRAPVAMRDGV